MASYVAFLRGINVGAHHRVSMADVRAVFEHVGHHQVRSYLQSGNVVFRAATGSGQEPQIAAQLEAEFRERFGFTSAIILRSSAELAGLEARNPFRDAEPDDTKLHVLFTAVAPSAEVVARLDPDAALPDRFGVDGREVFVWYPHGAGRSRLALDLGTPATARNWRTVTSVLALMAAHSD